MYKKEEQQQEESEKPEKKSETIKEPVKKIEKKEVVKTPEQAKKKKEEKINQTDLGYEHGLLTKRDFPDNEPQEEKEEETEWGEFTRIIFKMVQLLWKKPKY